VTALGQRIETDRGIAFRSHWGYQSKYCNPASGNEKAGVEGELGWYRRNCLVPVPEAASVTALNQHLLATCLANRSRTISGKGMTIGQASEHERAFLSPLAKKGFPIHEVLYPLIVDGKGRVKVKTNWYSAPLWPGLRVTALVWPLSIEIRRDGECVAQHPRCYGRGHQILNLEHYLDVLEKKPGAMAGSTPLEQWRQAGRTGGVQRFRDWRGAIVSRAQCRARFLMGARPSRGGRISQLHAHAL
jgi:hypothetical protein